MSVCRELTKKHETIFRTSLEQAVRYYETHEPKGECVLVIEGKSLQKIQEETRKQWEQMTIQEHMEHYMSQGTEKKEAMKKVAKDRGISKREVYQALLS